MDYYVGQQNYHGGGSGDESFANPIVGGTAEVITNSDNNVTGGLGFSFSNPQLNLTDAHAERGGGDGKLKPGVKYCFHAKIKRLDNLQTFYIRLIQVENNKIVLSQYLKTIDIAEIVNTEVVDPITNFVDVECVFTPLENFNGIMFELQRGQSDLNYIDERGIVIGRTPIIGYIELSIIENQISTALSPVTGIESLAKIGVQSHPGLTMCINGEEIHVPRSGIFELRDGIVPINFFSIVGMQVPVGTQLTEQMLSPDIQSASFLEAPKTRVISNFTLDYLYARI